MFLSARPPAAPLAAAMPAICAATTVAVVVAIAAAAAATLAPSILPPANAEGPEPGTLAFSFGSLGTDDNEFDGISSVSIDSNGKIYVVDHGNSAIKVFHPNGTFDYALPRGDVQYLFFGMDWVLYARVGIFTTSPIAPFHPNGTLSSMTNIRGVISVGPDGELYTASRYQVHVHDPNGTRVFSFGSLGEGPGELNRPNRVDVGPDGKIYVADSTDRIQAFHPNGTYVFQFGASQFDLRFGPSGEYFWEAGLYYPNGTAASGDFNRHFYNAQFGPTGMLVAYDASRVYR